jgi:hypothetical protein
MWAGSGRMSERPDRRLTEPPNDGGGEVAARRSTPALDERSEAQARHECVYFVRSLDPTGAGAGHNEREAEIEP